MEDRWRVALLWEDWVKSLDELRGAASEGKLGAPECKNPFFIFLQGCEVRPMPTMDIACSLDGTPCDGNGGALGAGNTSWRGGAKQAGRHAHEDGEPSAQGRAATALH